MTDLAPAAQRGSTEIRPRAVEAVVAETARRTPGTVVRRRRVPGLPGPRGGDPAVEVTMHGPVARVRVDVHVAWPAPLARVAADVRGRLADEASRLAGLEFRTVDVTVHAVDPVHVATGQRSAGRVR
ncbi:Asp23/Gls24 family envelope stress response protein [Nocardioides acrostichi]|uniref:Asp23/Gls24 family envelope stress response protein n=1 Tax=Nocardioides acrostichi TaxID=2784339 RepID=A0A930Y5V8_9ACTN|nr:hypothetical protein [Nocardioides acrostichi]MBF4161660.1 hypothetical protein [Nocardioides acrostichi]